MTTDLASLTEDERRPSPKRPPSSPRMPIRAPPSRSAPRPSAPSMSSASPRARRERPVIPSFNVWPRNHGARPKRNASVTSRKPELRRGPTAALPWSGPCARIPASARTGLCDECHVGVFQYKPAGPGGALRMTCWGKHRLHCDECGATRTCSRRGVPTTCGAATSASRSSWRDPSSPSPARSSP